MGPQNRKFWGTPISLEGELNPLKREEIKVGKETPKGKSQIRMEKKFRP